MSDTQLSGIRVLEETEGTGPATDRGDLVEFDSQGYLNRGECIQERVTTTTKLGSRQIIAGIENSLIGMKAGGYRKVKISPHLAYRHKGVADRIPSNAVLIYELWMLRVEKQASRMSSTLGGER